jgi:MFS family permease
MIDKRQAWLVMIVAFAAGVTTTVNQFKVPPVLPALAAELGLDAAEAGWLMSVFSVAAVVLSIPAALLLGRIGFKAMGAIALGCVVAGSALGALAPSATVLLLSRVIEGISIALIAVVAPALISRWFRPDELGLPMGIWATWVPAGSVLIFNLAPFLARAAGWRGLWWFGAALGLVLLVIYALVARPPGAAAAPAPSPVAAGERGPGQSEARQDRASATAPGARRTLAAVLSPGNWLLGLAFGCFAFALISYNTWVPTYLAGELGIPPSRASFYASLIFLAGIAANLLAGWLIAHLRHRHVLLVAAFAATALLYVWSFSLPAAPVVVIPYLLFLGFSANLVPTAVFTLAPETVRHAELAGVAMAVLNVVANTGILLGPPLLGALAGGGQWALASGLLVGVSIVGMGASVVAWRVAGRD